MSETPKPSRFPLVASGVAGLTGVALGAIGAHALKLTLTERGMTAAWETAARYHLFHAVALLGVAAWAASRPNESDTRLLGRAAQAWCLGIVLFSGSLYCLALGGPRWLGPVTPLGGVALMAGWLALIVAAFKKSE